MHYRHGEPDFAMNRLHQCSISFTVADWLKVSLNLVQGYSLNSVLKWFYGIFAGIDENVIELFASALV